MKSRSTNLGIADDQRREQESFSIRYYVVTRVKGKDLVINGLELPD